MVWFYYRSGLATITTSAGILDLIIADYEAKECSHEVEDVLAAGSPCYRPSEDSAIDAGRYSLQCPIVQRGVVQVFYIVFFIKYKVSKYSILYSILLRITSISIRCPSILAERDFSPMLLSGCDGIR